MGTGKLGFLGFGVGARWTPLDGGKKGGSDMIGADGMVVIVLMNGA